MRIVHEINQLEMGGAERVVLGIATHDKENEHMVCTYKDGPMRGPLEAAGVKVYLEDGKARNDILADLAHVHTGGEESTMAGCVRGEIPTVETVHSPVVSAVRDEWVLARAGVSEAVARMNRKCVAVRNGVEIGRLACPEGEERADLKERLGVPRGAQVVGRLGRIGYDKCLEEFLVACKIIQDERPDTWFVVAGGEAKGAPAYLAAVKVMAASLPLRHVVFVPETEDVAPVYGAMDVFMYPSPTEGFGLVYMEAAACGAAVVAWETDVTRELLLGSAMLTKPTARALAEGTMVLLKRTSIMDEFAAYGRELVLSEFTAEHMAARYQKFYADAARMVGIGARKEEQIA